MDVLEKNELHSNTILLAMKQKKNMNLIKNLLGAKHKIIIFNSKKDLDCKPDLIIVDPTMFEKLETNITRIKEKMKPTYLPVMILLDKNNKKLLKNSNSFLNEYIIDDLLKIPSPKRQFIVRINNLLHIRELSLLAEKNYYTLAGESPVGIVILHEEKIVYVNSAFTKIAENPKEKILNDNILNYIDDEKTTEFENFLRDDKSENLLETKLKRLNYDKENKWIEVRFSNIMFQGEKSRLLIISDVSERKKSEEYIKYLSFNDKLTGLYNRAYFETELNRIDTARQLPLSIILGDVNGLKLVNDAFGHKKGNQFLQDISQLIEKNVRSEDIVARLGGDEFGILLPNTSKDSANKIVKRINSDCKKRSDNPIKLSVAFGTASKNKVEEDIDDIFNLAEDRMYRNKIAETKSVRNSIFSSLENTLYEKTNESKGHANRIEKLAIKFHNKLNLPKDILDELKLLARLHDIGKVAINKDILKKPGDLTDQEYESVKRHPEIGYQIIKEMPTLAQVSNGILSHHERWDGTGYPRGLKGKDIPLISRIINIIDSYDVMTHERAYKKAMSKKDALEEIENCAGKQFDPKLADEFIEMLKN